MKYDTWLEEPYDSSWREAEEDPRLEWCQDEFLSEEELLEDMYELYYSTIDDVE